MQTGLFGSWGRYIGHHYHSKSGPYCKQPPGQNGVASGPMTFLDIEDRLALEFFKT